MNQQEIADQLRRAAEEQERTTKELAEEIAKAAGRDGGA